MLSLSVHWVCQLVAVASGKETRAAPCKTGFLCTFAANGTSDSELTNSNVREGMKHQDHRDAKVEFMFLVGQPPEEERRVDISMAHYIFTGISARAAMSPRSSTHRTEESTMVDKVAFKNCQVQGTATIL